MLWGSTALSCSIAAPANEPLQAAGVAAAGTLVPLKTGISSRAGVAAVAARMDGIVD